MCVPFSRNRDSISFTFHFHETSLVRIAEIFQSIQGEGPLAGTESIFARTSGCNLRCWFCDTPYSSFHPQGDNQTCADILAAIADYSARHVVITGGEPLLFADNVELSRQLAADGYHVTFETAGTVFQPVSCDLMSISPKLSNSAPRDLPEWNERHETTRLNPDVIRQLTDQYNYILKFVVDRPDDVTEINSWLKNFDSISRDRVWLMPQATTVDELREKSPWIHQLADSHGFQFSPRQHIELFGNQPGT